MDGNWRDRDEDEEEENGALNYIQTGRDSLIFLIDVTESMFVKSEETGNIPFYLSIKCLKTTLENKIISSEKDLIGVIFFGSEKDKNPNEFKHIYVFQDLDQPGRERILEVEELFGDDIKTFKDKFGHSNNFSLSDALWTCSTVFSNCKMNLSHKRVLLFTNTDNPHAENKQLQQQAKIRAKDLFDLGIEIDILHIKKPGVSFDITEFYQDIEFLPEDEQYEKLPASEKIEELLARVRIKDHKKRSLGHLTLNLGKHIELAVNVYNLVRATTKPYAVKLAKSNNAELRNMTKTYAEDNGEILMPSDMKKYQEYGGQKIFMEIDDINQIKHFDDPGLMLIGFKPKSSLKFHHHIRPGQFIYPDEKSISGSTRLFSSLLQCCLEREKVIICRYIPRKNTPPRLVALVPQKEEKDEVGVQDIPPGFQLVFLPFSEDLRKLNLESKQEPSEHMIDKAKEIIKKLKFRYHPENFDNPAIQKHWRNIEALALDRDKPDDMEDHTMPDQEAIENRAGTLIEEFKALFPGGLQEENTGKRKQGASTGGGAKRAKSEELINVDIKHEADAGQLGRLTVNVLKEFCKKHGIKAGTKKADIIDAINNFFGIE
ncbi:inverted repeat-binding protein isoform X1 [Tachypleus tridentatus]|uniref:inverted repeat-binding protein isoform X1 n=1 Tax=Tachypleus tridentatus TaxID=6853 RepID=UPI003FD6343E